MTKASFIDPRKYKTIGSEYRSTVADSGVDLTMKEHRMIVWADGNFAYLQSDGSYMTVPVRLTVLQH
jgi:hypothetical protein